MITKAPKNISCHRLINLLKPYYSSLKARESEGHPYLMRSIKSILGISLINVEPVGLFDGTPYDPATGVGFLLIERCLFIDVVRSNEFDPVTKFYCFNALPYEMYHSAMMRLVINFGGDHSTKYIVNGKRTRTLATGMSIRHLTSNMLNGFYTMGW